jgi:hypothetical protein
MSISISEIRRPMSDPECPYCFAPLPEGKRHTCVPLRGRVHQTNALFFSDRGQPRLVRLHKGATLPTNAPPSWAIDRYPRPWDLSEPLGPICAAMEAAGLPQTFGRDAATVAVEYDGVGDLMQMWADSRDDAERMAIILDIEELIDDIKRVYSHEWSGAHLSSDARALATYMSDLSEEFWRAGWMRDLEFMLWSLIEGKETDASLTLTRDQLATLKSLSNACKGWIVFRRDTQETFVSMPEWVQLFAAWLSEKDPTNEGESK